MIFLNGQVLSGILTLKKKKKPLYLSFLTLKTIFTLKSNHVKKKKKLLIFSEEYLYKINGSKNLKREQ